jgi:protein AFG1
MQLPLSTIERHFYRQQRRVLPVYLINPWRRTTTTTTTTISRRSFASAGPGPGLGPITTHLEELVAQGDIQRDAHQFRAAQELDRLYKDLKRNDPPKLPPKPSPEVEETSFFSFSSLFSSANIKIPAYTGTSLLTPTVIKGAYLYGGVGCGKTFLMNAFYDSIQQGHPWSHDKQKVHYHKFMLSVHQHMHQVRQSSDYESGNLLPPVIQKIAEKGRLVCLDEFQVTDVADAMILKSLFEGLWQQGCVVVVTSNRAPQDLYLHGLQRERFLPFLDLLQEKCAVISMLDSETDYRMTLGAGGGSGIDGHGGTLTAGKVYFPKGEKDQFKKLYHEQTQGAPIHPVYLETQGRKVKIPQSCTSKGVARFSFEDLCTKALGAADYLVVGKHYHTVFVDSIPKLSINELNWLRRFITFIDTMYESHVKVLLQTNATSIDNIFTLEDDKSSYQQDEVFAFDRTRSRLEEMASPKYLASQWDGAKQPLQPARQTLNVETSISDAPERTQFQQK